MATETNTPQTLDLASVSEIVLQLFEACGTFPSPEKIRAFSQSLEGRWTRAEADYVLKEFPIRHGKLERVSELIDFVGAFREDHAPQQMPAECQLCHGTGFQMIMRGVARLAERCPCRGRYMPTVGVKGDWWEKLLDGTDRRLREMERK